MADQTATPAGIASDEAVAMPTLLRDVTMVALGGIALAGYAFYYASGTMVAHGQIGLEGDAYATAAQPETMVAHGYIHVG